jgi:hypothetical protein
LQPPQKKSPGRLRNRGSLVVGAALSSACRSPYV